MMLYLYKVFFCLKILQLIRLDLSDTTSERYKIKNPGDLCDTSSNENVAHFPIVLLPLSENCRFKVNPFASVI